MTKPKISEVTAFYNSNIKAVWNVVTNNKDYKWRSDIERIEVLNEGKEFIEYYKGGQLDRRNYNEKE